MSNTFYVLSELLLSVFEIALLVFSLIFCLRKNMVSYMKTFPIYAVGNVSADLIHNVFKDPHNLVGPIFTIFELLYFSYFITRVLESGIAKKVIWTYDVLLICFIIFHRFVRHDGVPASPLAIMLESIIMIIACLLYFRELLMKTNEIQPGRDPAFWVIIGIFIYFFLLLPSFWLAGYYDGLKMHNISMSFYSVNNWAQLVSISLYIKAITCWREK